MPGNIALMFLTLAGLQSASASDFGSWHGVSLKSLDTKHVDLVTIAQVRFYQNSQEFLQYFISQKVVVDVNPYLRTGLNYTFLPTRLDDSDPFTQQHRAELVFTPRWPVNDRLTLDFRNKLEIRWFEGFSENRNRTRHRIGGTYSFKDTGLLKSVFASNELFYDFTDQDLTQNRLQPAGIGLRISDNLVLQLYYMYQSIRLFDEWRNAHVIGTHLSFSL